MPLFLVIANLTERLSQLPDLGAWGLWGLFIGAFLASTVVPFSADVLYITVLNMTSSPWACLAVASLGNWLGNYAIAAFIVAGVFALLTLILFLLKNKLFVNGFVRLFAKIFFEDKEEEL